MSFESVCKFYSYNRNCKFGKNCRYLHNSEVSQRPPPHSIEKIDDKNGAVKKSDQPQSFQPRAHFVGSTDDIYNEDSLRPPHLRESSSCRENPVDESQCVISEPAANTGVTVNVNTAVAQPRNICRYFKQHGYCAFGRNCRFVHDKSDIRFTASASKPRHSENARKQIPPRFQRNSSKSTVGDIVIDQQFAECDVHFNQDDSSTKARDPAVESISRGTHNVSQGNGKPCRYYKSGYCSRGKRCMFMHYTGYKSNKDGEEKCDIATPDEKAARHDEKSHLFVDVKPPNKYPRSVRPTGVLPQVMRLPDLLSNGTEKYRQFDVNYLEKRFQAVKCCGSNEMKDSAKTEGTEIIMEMVFAPSDPDWPYDVKTFTLDMTLPGNYPEKAMSITVPSDKQDLPDTVRRYLEVCMNEWISDRQEELNKNNKAELMVRPFFRWLDRNCEDVMTEALKQLKRELTARAAGFEFIPATQLKAKYTVVEDDGNGSESQEDAGDSLTEDEEDSSDECLDSDDGSEQSQDDQKGRQPALDLDTDRRGTEIELRHLQLKQNASSLLFERLRLLIQCARCKHHSEITIGSEKAVALTCEKCHQEIFIQYRPTLAHQFSSIVGYLDLDSGLAFDLIFPDCKIVISCMSCGKITKINGMTSGQMMDGWCQACNARFKFALESIKFNQLQPSSLDEERKKQAEVSKPKNSKKPPKDPAIREGQPLPEFGTCRHYKQSYRWLRFPCCGKAYPCDVCHDKKEDHEMTLANRMICGHCCKEQNYSATRPCSSCGHHMTKVHSAHWEGGSGCRDRIAMSRNDQQKYKNMNKTISRKKGQSGSGSKSKNTKLRHA